MQPARGR